MAMKSFKDKVLKDGITYSEYSTINKTLVEKDFNSLSDEEKKTIDYTKLNVKRSARGDKVYKPSEDVKNLISKITSPQVWMLITEEWCGDSAQNLPYINKLAKLNENIDLRIILRDDNLDIMDQYLTNGTRSIPILVAFDKDWNEIFRWGPRPKEAADLVKQWKAEGQDKKEFIENLHLWYGRNRGKALDAEFKTILENVLVSA